MVSDIMNNIVLCGFMGCGKTTIGKQLAKLLNYKFIDMDKFIEEKTKMTISDIFKNHGESYFRKLETEVAVELSSQSNLVIGSGGGAVLKEDNVIAFKNGGKIVFIEVPLDIIKKRLTGDRSRPLLLENKLETMIKLFNEREPVYNSVCDIKIKNIDNKEPKLVALEIFNNLKP